MTKNGANGVGDFEDAFSSVPHAVASRLLLVIASQHYIYVQINMIMLTFLTFPHKVNS